MASGPPERIRVTEFLDLDLSSEQWICNRCGYILGPARQSYKKGCLLYDRDPRQIHPPLVNGAYNFSPDPEWVRIVEYYCPGCGAQVETEYLPPGHPLIVDIEIDVDGLMKRLRSGEFVIREKRLEVAE